ncbi:MAG: adenosine deaminase [Elusimicrobia bacterium]|nr:adenosine deaminase [Elusimicrobiota bacterium]
MEETKSGLEEKIKEMPKAELHRHLEGCVRVPTIIKLARQYGLKLPTFDAGELAKTAKLHAPMNSLAAVLKMFEIVQSVFVSYTALEEITFQALEDAYKNENIKLLELRYSPDFMLQGKDLDWQKSLEVMRGVVEKFEKANAFVGGIIVIASRSYGMNSVLKTIDFAVKNKAGIIGFDLADNEIDYPSRIYREAVKKLRQAGIPLTVHSGEEGKYTQVIETIEALCPRRIGHGVKAADDPSGRAMRLIKENAITIEANPYSNYLTHAVDSLEAHPLKKFIESGLSVCIGADDPEILDTSLNKEYRLCVEKMGLSFRDLDYTIKCALNGSFLNRDKKQQAADFLR